MRLGWCMSGHHNLCRARLETNHGLLTCACACHIPEPLAAVLSGVVAKLAARDGNAPEWAKGDV